MAVTYLLLGSNQGDRLYFLRVATEHIAALPGQLITKSAIYQTEAWGLPNQPDFLNQVLQFNTMLSPEELLENINRIEQELGRIRVIKWGERVIDIDILYYDDLILNTPKLLIPHPHLQERRFTLMPLVEIAPDYRHPIYQVTNKDLLAKCPDQLEVVVYQK
jgi:2-amino-4-hydroxy-6-hydroxymethyldihydropteridine diphosphokinase